MGRSAIVEADGFQVEVRRTERKKTVSLQVRDGCVQLLAPRRTPQAFLEELVARKHAWILDRLLRQALPAKRHVSGESFYYLGQPVVLDVRSGMPRGVDLTGDVLRVTLPRNEEQAVRRALERWYRRQADGLLGARVAYHAERLGLYPSVVQVRSYRARWGSCHPDGALRFNWKLVMAPEPVIDYVAIHELCHLAEPNHSPAFWSRVERACPDYRSHREWLKQHGGRLCL